MKKCPKCNKLIPTKNREYCSRSCYKSDEIGRFFDKVYIEDEQACWLWLGHKNILGYGKLSYKGKIKQAHRVIFEIIGQPIKYNLVVDHMCKNTSCVNPSHLREVTFKQNIFENSNSPAYTRKVSTHCERGHKWTDDNIYWAKGKNGVIYRHCRKCTLSRQAKYREQKRKDKLKALEE